MILSHQVGKLGATCYCFLTLLELLNLLEETASGLALFHSDYSTLFFEHHENLYK